MILTPLIFAMGAQVPIGWNKCNFDWLKCKCEGAGSFYGKDREGEFKILKVEC